MEPTETTPEAPALAIVPDAPPEAKAPSIEDQIKALTEQLDKLEAERQKSVIEDLVFEPEALAALAKQRQKERYPGAVKQVERHLKQLAWSGERLAEFSPTTPIFNQEIVKQLIKDGWKASVSTAKDGEQKIRVVW